MMMIVIPSMMMMMPRNMVVGHILSQKAFGFEGIETHKKNKVFDVI